MSRLYNFCLNDFYSENKETEIDMTFVKQNMEGYKPKRVNPVSNIIGVNSLWLGGLQMHLYIDEYFHHVTPGSHHTMYGLDITG